MRGRTHVAIHEGLRPMHSWKTWCGLPLANTPHWISDLAAKHDPGCREKVTCSRCRRKLD